MPSSNEESRRCMHDADSIPASWRTRLSSCELGFIQPRTFVCIIADSRTMATENERMFALDPQNRGQTSEKSMRFKLGVIVPENDLARTQGSRNIDDPLIR